MATGTRGRVLDHTLRLVAERGLAGTNVIDIEAAVGLSPGSGAFYRHFPSKEDALRAAVNREFDRLRERVQEPPAEMPTSGDRQSDVSAQLEAGIAWLQELAPLIAILAREGGNQPELARDLQEIMNAGGMTSGLELVAAAAADAGRDPTDSAVVAVMASVGYHLAEAFFGTPPGGLDPRRFCTVLADMICAPSRTRQP